MSNDWRPVNNGKGEKKFWDQVEPEIKTVLSDDDGNFVEKRVEEFRGYKYTCKSYGGKPMVFRIGIDGSDGKSEENSAQTEPQSSVGFTTVPVIEDDKLVVKVNGGEKKIELVDGFKSDVIEDVKMLTVKEFDKISGFLGNGYIPFGNNFNESYRDGFFALIKYRSAPQSEQ